VHKERCALSHCGATAVEDCKLEITKLAIPHAANMITKPITPLVMAFLPSAVWSSFPAAVIILNPPTRMNITAIIPKNPSARLIIRATVPFKSFDWLKPVLPKLEASSPNPCSDTLIHTPSQAPPVGASAVALEQSFVFAENLASVKLTTSHTSPEMQISDLIVEKVLQPSPFAARVLMSDFALTESGRPMAAKNRAHRIFGKIFLKLINFD